MKNLPAFPYFIERAASIDYCYGMSLRDYFAAAALQGLIACAEVRLESYQKYAQQAYDQADAMLAEREKGNQ